MIVAPSGSAQDRVRMHPVGDRHYMISVNRYSVARAFVAGYRTKPETRAEVWIEHPDGTVTEMFTAYFPDLGC